MMKMLHALLFPLEGWPLAVMIVLSMILSSVIVNKMNYEFLSKIYYFFRIRPIEKDGMIYEKYFKIRKWKEYVPSVSSFDKKHLERNITIPYLKAYLLENLRAEVCHHMMLIMGIVFVFITPSYVNSRIISFTAVANIPCIMIQRYNRPRFEKVLKRKLEMESEVKEECKSADESVSWIL